MNSIPNVDYTPPTGGIQTINQGDSYLTSNGNPIVWDFSEIYTLPDLSGASIQVLIGRSVPMKTPPGTAGLSVVGNVIDDEYANIRISIDLTAPQTTNMATGSPAYNVQIIATLESGEIKTILTSTLNVNPRISEPVAGFGGYGYIT